MAQPTIDQFSDKDFLECYDLKDLNDLLIIKNTILNTDLIDDHTTTDLQIINQLIADFYLDDQNI